MPRRPPPSFAVTDAPPSPRSVPWRWVAEVVVLALVLVLQLMLADRHRLAADAGWRPRLEMLCGALDCTLPPWREPDAMRVTAREVRPHPKVPGVLLVTLSFRNDARWAQPWPLMEIALHDLDGQSLGMRRFTPTEYLGSPPAETAIAPGQSASATLEILDPGSRAVAFTFDFH